jgi:hypothetical protein
MMKGFRKTVTLILILLTMLVPISEGTKVTTASIELDLSNETLAFLRDVIKVDLVKYNITQVVGPIIEKPSWLGGELTLVHGKYNLTSENSWVEVLYHFVNGTLSYCIARVRVGQLQLSEQKPADLREASDNFLQRYQTYTSDSNVDAMRSMVQNVDLSMSRTSTSTSNLRLNVNVDSSTSAFFEWYNTIDGAAYSGLKVSFQDGVFSGFTDDRSYFRAAGAPVIVTEKQAVDRALACAANFSYTYGGKTVSNFNVAESYIRSALLTKGRDDVLVWYPYWQVTLPLSGSYPGYVSCIVVQIWADTAQVISVVPTGSDMGVLETPEPSTSTQPSPSEGASPVASASNSPESTSTLAPSATQEPAQTVPNETVLQPSSSLQPAENGGDRKNDSALLIVVAVVCVGVAIVVSAGFVLRRRRVRG